MAGYTRIIILTDGKQYETWGSLAQLCREHGFSYSYLSTKKFPFKYKGMDFLKVPFRKKTIDTSLWKK